MPRSSLHTGHAGHTDRRLLAIYAALHDAYGPQHWWPARTPFEMMAGAVLTQATSWTAVEKTIANLEVPSLLTPSALRQVPQDRLAALLRPCGYFNAKAVKLQALAHYLAQYDDDLGLLFQRPEQEVRMDLLGVHGVGPETADCMLLYAGGIPVFVVDTYTRRIFERVGQGPAHAGYSTLQGWFHQHLPRDAALFNEYHALLVRLGKEACHPQPRCGQCPLRALCATGKRRVSDA